MFQNGRFYKTTFTHLLKLFSLLSEVSFAFRLSLYSFSYETYMYLTMMESQ